MRARLGFATALLNNASVLLIDEVLSVGDKKFKDKAKLALEDRFSDSRSIVVVSHTEAQIKHLCDSAIFIENGGITMDADVRSVLARYAKL